MSLHLLIGRSTAWIRRFIARHRLTRWIPIVVGCGGLVVAVHHRTELLDNARAEWSDTRTVWAAVREHAPGDEIDAAATELPVVAVPDGAVEDLPAGASAHQWLGIGEVIVAADLAGPGPLGLVPSNHRAVAVRESVVSGVEVGEHVDVVSEGIVITDAAIVVAVGDDTVLLAVATADAPVVALASEAGVSLLRAATP